MSGRFGAGRHFPGRRRSDPFPMSAVIWIIIPETLGGRMRFVLAAALIVLMPPALLRGQVITAAVNGVVLDPTGAAVPQAKVRAVNQSTNLEVRTTTDSEGRYTFPSLPPGGPYSVIAEAAGFSAEE